MCIAGWCETRLKRPCFRPIHAHKRQDGHAKVEVLALTLKLPTLRFAVCLASALRYAKVLPYASSASARQVALRAGWYTRAL
jgi:hypothetical protein